MSSSVCQETDKTGKKKWEGKKGNQLSLYKWVIKHFCSLYSVCKRLTEFLGRKYCSRGVNLCLWSTFYSSDMANGFYV